MNSRITTADISDHFPIFLISEKELNYKQYKAIFESLKKKIKERLLFRAYRFIQIEYEKTWDIMKEITVNKRVTNAPLIFYQGEKQKNI